MNKTIPEICWRKFKDVHCLYFCFYGELSHEGAIDGIDRWQRLLEENPTGKVTLVWDARKMTGYEKEARRAWQDMLQRTKLQIDTIWLVSNSAFIRVGASVMSVFTRLKIRAVSDLHEVAP